MMPPNVAAAQDLTTAYAYNVASFITAVNDNRPTADTALNPGVEAC